ncbi:hypothetical protein ACET8O_20160 [Aeromonas veronii]
MSEAMEKELLAWRAMFAQLAAAIHQPDAIDRIKAVVGHDAPLLEGGLGDTMWWEYVKLKQGGQLPMHSLADLPAPAGVMVLTYERGGNGWGFTPNEWTGEKWRRRGSWTHWGHMVLVPSHGPDGAPVLFDESQARINSVKLMFSETDRPLNQSSFYSVALNLTEIYFLLRQLNGDSNLFTTARAREFHSEFCDIFGIEIDLKSPTYPTDPLGSLLAIANELRRK